MLEITEYTWAFRGDTVNLLPLSNTVLVAVTSSSFAKIPFILVVSILIHIHHFFQK